LQVERLEAKVINPLKLYGTQIKQTRVSWDTSGGRQWGLAQQNPGKQRLLFFRLRSRNLNVSEIMRSNNYRSWRN
jgi:hypothetical protein